MASPADRLATSLAQLAELQENGRRVFRSDELTRVHRERLLQNGFLQEVVRGWLISTSPGTGPGDTTPWFASFWEFCARYCTKRFGEQWHLSPEQSLLLHAENTAIPRKVTIYTPKGTNNKIELPFDTSLYDLRQQLPNTADLASRDGLHIYRPEAALIRVTETFYTRHPIEAQVVLSDLRDSSDVLRYLLDDGHTLVAGRIAGALRRIGRADLADDIVGSMGAAGYDVREHDPFTPGRTSRTPATAAAPIAKRLQSMWEAFRAQVIETFPRAPGLPRDQREYLRSVDEIYQNDAYHSLSIEGYRVSPDLVERVRSGGWDPDTHDADRRSRDALAARGYWQAFQVVRTAVQDIMLGHEPVAVITASHREWYRELFQPCVAAGLVDASLLAGYRNHAVFLRGSRHVPPRSDAVRDAMPVLFDLLHDESEPSVRAVLGHWLLGYIHPYPDGNGRIARFLMNAMLASGGYPWTVIRLDDRDTYLTALEAASTGADIRPFASFVAGCVTRTMDS